MFYNCQFTKFKDLFCFEKCILALDMDNEVWIIAATDESLELTKYETKMINIPTITNIKRNLEKELARSFEIDKIYYEDKSLIFSEKNSSTLVRYLVRTEKTIHTTKAVDDVNGIKVEPEDLAEEANFLANITGEGAENEAGLSYEDMQMQQILAMEFAE